MTLTLDLQKLFKCRHSLISLLYIFVPFSTWWGRNKICLSNSCSLIYFFLSSAPTCRKEQFTEYYVENGCRSRRPIKNAICSGTCGTHCCKPRRTKQRQVRLICNDGTSYKKEIEIIRKCRCRRRCYWKKWNINKVNWILMERLSFHNQKKTFKCEN